MLSNKNFRIQLEILMTMRNQMSLYRKNWINMIKKKRIKMTKIKYGNKTNKNKTRMKMAKLPHPEATTQLELLKLNNKML